MPNFKTHASAGAIAGVLVSIYEYQQIKLDDPNAEFDFLELLINTFAGMAGASLPDKMEPAYHPNHRSTFHSFSVAVFNVRGMSSTSNIEQLDPRLISATKAFLFGYLSHRALEFYNSPKPPNCLSLMAGPDTSPRKTRMTPGKKTRSPATGAMRLRCPDRAVWRPYRQWPKRYLQTLVPNPVTTA